ncbi:hypothetical protein ACW0I1_19625, partial [Salmonella enterica subsp. enterica serovar Saintpaul]
GPDNMYAENGIYLIGKACRPSENSESNCEEVLTSEPGVASFDFMSSAIIRRRPGRYDTDNTLENLTVKAATGEKQWPVSTAFA